MINHISIAVHNTKRVAEVLAELWNGYVFPFPPSPDSYFVLADDGRGSAVEVTPINTVLIPGEGFPPEENFDATTPTEEYEAKFVESDFSPRYTATHLAINTLLSAEEVKQIANREGWRTITANRGGGAFQLIEVWVENRFMLEVFTPEMTVRYVEVMKPQFLAQAMENMPLPPNQVVANELNLIG
jgi:hypothetical protein